MHVSYEYRGKGIGRKLFTLSLETMKNCVAKKVYIVANPSEESQAFYRAMGCVEAEEIIPELYDDSYDVHMEFAL
jgi:ribosomal protein S18 acetylase RimI-like enzyme